MRTKHFRSPRPKTPADDVFNFLPELRIPPVAYVAGAGPGLQKQLEAMPDDAWVVACNSAILLDYPYKAWMVYDPGAWKFDWFWHQHPNEPLRIFGQQIRYYHDVHNDVHGRPKLHLDYSWQHRPVSRATQPILDGVLCGGGTVSCCAAQLLFWAGCEHARLAGVPMQGLKHFDGSRAHHLRGAWHQARCFNRINQVMQSRGMKITSMGPTALELKVEP